MQDTKEIWKPIPNYEGLYEASNFGRIKSLNRIVTDCNRDFTRSIKEKMLSFSLSKKGYFYTTLCNMGKRKKFLVHRVYAETWISNPLNLPCINHIDGNKLNNNRFNLEWCSFSSNNKHAYDLGLKIPYIRNGEKNPKAVLNDEIVRKIREMTANCKSILEISKDLKINKSTIRDVVVGKSWVHVI